MALTAKIKKRNGEIVDFNPEKVTTAVKKAFFAVLKDEHQGDAQDITRVVVESIDQRFGGTALVPSVEDIQDLVENALMERGYFSVAKSYIIYRYEHSKEREEQRAELARKIESKQLSVKKRDGTAEVFSIEKVKKTLAFVSADQNVVDVNLIAKQVGMEVFDGISTKDITRTLIMVTRSMIEADPAYSVVASRLLLHSLYKETLGADTFDYKEFLTQYREGFVANVRRAIELKKLDARLGEFDLAAIAKMLMPERDDNLRYMGLETLRDRYFVRESEKGRLLESPQYFWMRVAMGLALGEKPEDRMRHIKEFYDVMSELHYVPSTPTLFNAGAPIAQLSSCYLNTVMDDLESIFKVYGDNAQLSKWTGGIGTDWTNLRGTGALIKKAGITSQGVIPFLKIANDVTVAINRSGRRRGATCAYLEIWHYDIEDFIELRKNTGDERRRTHDMNTASWINDLFMKRVREDGDWTLFSPDEVPELHHLYGRAFEDAYVRYEEMTRAGTINLFKTMKARDLWKKLLTQLFETGHPWVTFKDPSNVRSPQDHVGVVHNSNLCTEITLNTSADETAVCNLGSVNFARHVKNGAFDGEKVAATVKTAMRMLDNVIDLNFYPTKEARNSNLKHRPVGLGIMGFQDALYQLGLTFDSPECVDFADRSMEIVSYYAILSSSELARERGAYESFKGSKWDRGIFPIDTIDLLEQERGEAIPVSREVRLDWAKARAHVKQYGMRNSNTMAIAPTATISNISGCMPAIEPIYKNIYVKSNISGDFTVVNHYLIEDLKRLGLWDAEMLGKLKYNDGKLEGILEIPEAIRAKYKETFEIDMTWLVRAAAERGKWIDQSQSLNIFFRGQSGRELSDIYFYAWSMGLKTTYYLRTLGASQVEKSTVDSAAFGATHTRKKDESHGEGAPAGSNAAADAAPMEPQASPLGRAPGSEPAQAPMFSRAVSPAMQAALPSSAHAGQGITPVPISPSPLSEQSKVVIASTISAEAVTRPKVPVIARMEAPHEGTRTVSAPAVADSPLQSAAPIRQAAADMSAHAGQPKKQYNIEKIGDAVCEACE